MNESATGTGSTKEAQAGKYLTFLLDGETYGLAILGVQEIIGMVEVNHVPRTPAFVRGVINLRGRVIPVVDLRIKFERNSKGDTGRTCVVVLQVERHGGPVTMGIIVDEVCEVMSVASEQLASRPSFGKRMDLDFIMGMARIGQKVVMLLDADRVLSDREVDSVIATPETEVPA